MRENLDPISQVMAQHRKECLKINTENHGRVLTKVAEFHHGDVIRVTSHESNCGIDQTIFMALVVKSKNYGVIVIPQDFQAHIYNQVVLKGASWETEVDWLLGNDVEIELVQRFF